MCHFGLMSGRSMENILAWKIFWWVDEAGFSLVIIKILIYSCILFFDFFHLPTPYPRLIRTQNLKQRGGLFSNNSGVNKGTWHHYSLVILSIFFVTLVLTSPNQTYLILSQVKPTNLTFLVSSSLTCKCSKQNFISKNSI